MDDKEGGTKMQGHLNVKVSLAARLMQKSDQFIRIGLQRNLLPFGTAVKIGNRYNYHISAAPFNNYSAFNAQKQQKNA